MKMPFRIICPIVLLFAMAVACNLPSAQVNEINKTNPAVTISGEGTIISSTTSSENILQITKDVTFTPSQITPSSQAATITSIEDTNCRKGPGVMYEKVGELLVGQTSEVVAKFQSNDNKQYWLIKNPANPAQECWVQGATTSVTGNTINLPVATPLPTPEVTLSLTIYAIISPITYSGGCPVTVELTGNYTINAPAIITYQWYIGDLLVTSGAATAGSSGTYTSTDQITITSTTTNPIRLRASVLPKTVTTSPIGFSIICN